jgi:hypothetical protein
MRMDFVVQFPKLPSSVVALSVLRAASLVRSKHKRAIQKDSGFWLGITAIVMFLEMQIMAHKLSHTNVGTLADRFPCR